MFLEWQDHVTMKKKISFTIAGINVNVLTLKSNFKYLIFHNNTACTVFDQITA